MRMYTVLAEDQYIGKECPHWNGQRNQSGQAVIYDGKEKDTAEYRYEVAKSYFGRVWLFAGSRDLGHAIALYDVEKHIDQLCLQANGQPWE